MMDIFTDGAVGADRHLQCSRPVCSFGPRPARGQVPADLQVHWSAGQVRLQAGAVFRGRVASGQGWIRHMLRLVDPLHRRRGHAGLAILPRQVVAAVTAGQLPALLTASHTFGFQCRTVDSDFTGVWGGPSLRKLVIHTCIHLHMH